MANLFNLRLEKEFLSAAIRDPSVLAECPYIGEKDFSEANRKVFSGLKATLASGHEYSKYLLINRLAALNVKIADTLDPEVYINALDMKGVSREAGVGIGKELKIQTILRETYETGRAVMQWAEKAAGKTASEIVGGATKIFNDKVNLMDGREEHEPVDLYGTIKSFLHIDHSFSARAIALPFPIMNDLFGYLDAGSVYLIASRMKIGKSSFWLDAGKQMAEQDKDDTLRVLVLDTELEAKENQSRSLAAVSGVSEFRVRQGWYKRRPDELRRVEEAAEYLSPFTQRVQHVYVGGMELEEILSVARRWAFKNLTAGKRGLIVYDYFKLNSSVDFKSNTSLFIKLGEKMDAFKKLSKELQVPVLSFAQTNRENVETKGGDKQQNSAVIGGSDMLAQFASNIYLLEELTPDERAALNQLGDDGATHSLREIACRQRGPCEMGEDRLVALKDPKSKKTRHVKNYLLFRFKTFTVTEVGTLKQIVEKNALTGFNVQGAAPDEPPASLV